VKVSVSIVAYKHEKFIGECLESVVAQKTSFPFEVIVGEDGSPDRTAEVIRAIAAKHPGVVKPIFHSPNVGVRSNWQSVLDACGGEYVAHLDGDDRMLPGKLQKEADFLDARPEVAVVFHRVRLFDSVTGATVGEMPRRGEPVHASVDDIVRYRNSFSSASPMFRRSAMPRAIDPALKMVLDWFMQIAVAQNGQVGFIDEVLGEYRQHPGGVMQANLAGWERLLGDQLYTLQLARGMKVSPAAVDEAEARLRAHFADQLLLAGRDAEFTEWILGSSRKMIFSFPHEVRVRLAHAPRLARLLVRAAGVYYSLRERLRYGVDER
jgi:glycosyltransferase involved in cell wall biosynthesis